MNRTRAPLALLATLVFGCATTKVGAPATSASVENIRRENPGATLVVERLEPAAADCSASPRAGRLTLVRTTPTETIVTASREGAPSQISLRSSDVASLTVTHHLRGALYGAGVGALLATAVTVWAALTFGPCDGCENDFTRGDAARAFGLRVGLPAFVLSTGVGALIGTRTTYVFE